MDHRVEVDPARQRAALGPDRAQVAPAHRHAPPPPLLPALVTVTSSRRAGHDPGDHLAPALGSPTPGATIDITGADYVR